MSTVLRWWMIFCISILSLVVLYYTGFYEELKEKDTTYISFIIIAIYMIASVYLGKVSLDKDRGKPVDKGINAGYYIYDLLPILGLIGTVVGFIMMFGGSFAEINTSDAQSVRDALLTMALGISTALYTTLVGMVCSEIIKLQLINIEASS